MDIDGRLSSQKHVCQRVHGLRSLWFTSELRHKTAASSATFTSHLICERKTCLKSQSSSDTLESCVCGSKSQKHLVSSTSETHKSKTCFDVHIPLLAFDFLYQILIKTSKAIRRALSCRSKPYENLKVTRTGTPPTSRSSMFAVRLFS